MNGVIYFVVIYDERKIDLVDIRVTRCPKVVESPKILLTWYPDFFLCMYD